MQLTEREAKEIISDRLSYGWREMCTRFKHKLRTNWLFTVSFICLLCAIIILVGGAYCLSEASEQPTTYLTQDGHTVTLWPHTYDGVALTKVETPWTQDIKNYFAQFKGVISIPLFVAALIIFIVIAKAGTLSLRKPDEPEYKAEFDAALTHWKETGELPSIREGGDTPSSGVDTERQKGKETEQCLR